MRSRRWINLTAGMAIAVAAGAPPLAAQQAERPLRLVMNTELQVIDPHVSPSYVTRTFGFMVFDTLVGMDSQGRFHPQMLENWQASDDRLTWTFRLRPGLEWHDGSPVTAEDCIASLRRWGTNDGLGRQLIAATRDMRVVDQNTFVLELSRPFSQVIEALGKPSPYVAFMMPARLAAQAPFSSGARNGGRATASSFIATLATGPGPSPRTSPPAARSCTSNGPSSSACLILPCARRRSSRVRWTTWNTRRWISSSGSSATETSS